MRLIPFDSSVYGNGRILSRTPPIPGFRTAGPSRGRTPPGQNPAAAVDKCFAIEGNERWGSEQREAWTTDGWQSRRSIRQWKRITISRTPCWWHGTSDRKRPDDSAAMNGAGSNTVVWRAA